MRTEPEPPPPWAGPGRTPRRAGADGDSAGAARTEGRGEEGEGASRKAPQGTGRAGGRAVTRMYRLGGARMEGGHPAGECARAPGCQHTAHAPALTPSVSGRGGGSETEAGGRGGRLRVVLLKGAAGRQLVLGTAIFLEAPELPMQLSRLRTKRVGKPIGAFRASQLGAFCQASASCKLKEHIYIHTLIYTRIYPVPIGSCPIL